MTEETNKKRWWEILCELTPLIIGICVTGGGAYFTYLHNEQELKLTKITTLEKFRDELISDDSVKRKFAYSVFFDLGYKTLALDLVAIKNDPAGHDVVQKIQQSSGGITKETATELLSSLPVLIYLQMANENQKVSVEKIRSILLDSQKRKYDVPEIGSVRGVAPQTTEIRYFNKDDESIAKGITEILKENKITSKETLVSGYKANQGNVEIWFSKDIK